DCARDSSCYSGFCEHQSVDATAPDGGCSTGGGLESCYDGVPDTRDVGVCRAGQRFCVNGAFTDCLGQVLAHGETCNGDDDDCDGEIDDVAVTSGCDTQLQGACAEGSLVCRSGVQFCQPARQSQTEQCNDIDDDCDGSTDEVMAAPCYPDGVPGCAQDSQGSWQCQGRCMTGMLDCSVEQTCVGAMTPADEVCGGGDEFAQDENCDGMIDEGCACSTGSTRECFAGPAGTNGRGICRAGTQTCVDATWGACRGQVVPRAETCENAGADDDCNDAIDDVAGVGEPCVASGQFGVCRDGILACVPGAFSPQCVAGSAAVERCDDIDQDCNGDPTNGFDLTSDARCGACDVQCAPFTHTCCGGGCIARADLEKDLKNCGACGNACGAGQYCCQGECLIKSTMMVPACDCLVSCGSLSCCGAMCKDLPSDKDNCGACGLKCGRGKECLAGVCH
ncbi:MAG TPA: MopE-related protein, partial [Polyangiales bacterium]|nr:MopE-related protein [Polyangiales bacterium]